MVTANDSVEGRWLVADVRSALADQLFAQPDPSDMSLVAQDPGGRLAQAAVAAILRDTERGAEVLFIRRATREGDPWSGHMALPGGRREPADDTVVATAIREAREEVGIDLATAGELLGALPALPATARGRRVPMTIHPFVFALSRPVEIAHSEEVEESLWVLLSSLPQRRSRIRQPLPLPGAESGPRSEPPRTIDLPAWDIDGRIVWGLTHAMITLLLKAVERRVESSGTKAHDGGPARQ